MFEWGDELVRVEPRPRLPGDPRRRGRNGRRAAILPAPPGSGKSTLCAALVPRLAPAVRRTGPGAPGRRHASMPLPRPVSLKNASIGIIRAYAPRRRVQPPVHDTIKGTVAHLKRAGRQRRARRRAGAPGLDRVPQVRGRRRAELAPVARAPRLHAAGRQRLQLQPAGRRRLRCAGAPGRRARRCYDFTYSALDDALDTFDAPGARRRMSGAAAAAAGAARARTRWPRSAWPNGTCCCARPARQPAGRAWHCLADEHGAAGRGCRRRRARHLDWAARRWRSATAQAVRFEVAQIRARAGRARPAADPAQGRRLCGGRPAAGARAACFPTSTSWCRRTALAEVEAALMLHGWVVAPPRRLRPALLPRVDARTAADAARAARQR